MSSISAEIKEKFDDSAFRGMNYGLLQQNCSPAQIEALGEVLYGYLDSRFTPAEIINIVKNLTPEEITKFGEQLGFYSALFKPETLASMFKNGDLKDVIKLGQEHLFGAERVSTSAPQAEGEVREPGSPAK